MTTASASSAIRRNRSGKSPPRVRSVWLKTAKFEKSDAPNPPMCGKYSAKCGSHTPRASAFGSEQQHALALVHDKSLNEHQTDKGLSQAYAIA